MIVIWFLICVAGGFFVQPWIVWCAKRLWRCGLIGFWVTSSTRERWNRNSSLFQDSLEYQLKMQSIEILRTYHASMYLSPK